MIFRNPVAGYIHPHSYTGAVNATNWKVTQPFGCTGYPAEPPLGTCSHFHRGLDIWNNRTGDPVYAPQSGKVHWSGVTTDGANVIEIDHGGGVGTAVGHLKSRLVGTGATVTKGQKIGYHDCTGNCSGPHIHFVVKYGVSWSRSMLSDTNGHWIDPWPHLEQNVTVRPTGSGILIRLAPGGAQYAHTMPDGHIRRIADNADLGLTSAWYKWGGNVASTALGQAFWRKISLKSPTGAPAYYYIGNTVSVQSAS
jgi:murein DD-endopeptidase MepM/ murein hydrolase activator NlpD